MKRGRTFPAQLGSSTKSESVSLIPQTAGTAAVCTSFYPHSSAICDVTLEIFKPVKIPQPHYVDGISLLVKCTYITLNYSHNVALLLR